MKRLCLLICLLVLSAAAAQSYAERFDTAWRLVDERYWDLTRLPVDWDEIRVRYERRALAITDDDAYTVKLGDTLSAIALHYYGSAGRSAYMRIAERNALDDPDLIRVGQQLVIPGSPDEAFFAVLEEMYDLLGDSHSVFVPPAQVAEIRRSYGDLPCLGVFSQRSGTERIGNVSYRLLEGQIGYLQIPDMATTGVAQWAREAIQDLNRRDVTGFIIDLRGNPGGRLVEMMQLAGIFTRGFLWRTVTRWTLPLPYPAIGAVETEMPLVVLIDGGVNSAAEGLAGALQQRERATIVGERSAGNVEAVLPFCLRDGSQAWIATGVLAPIGGPTWEGVGVIPDIASRPEEALKVGLDFLLGR